VRVSLVSPGGVNTPIYAQAANYAGRVGRPPPPVDRPETVARAIIKAVNLTPYNYTKHGMNLTSLEAIFARQ